MCLQCKRLGFNPWMGKIPWRRAWQPTPAFLPGKIPETEEPGELKESDMTERLSHTHTHTHTHKADDGKLSCKISPQSFKFNSQQLFILFHEGE